MPRLRHAAAREFARRLLSRRGALRSGRLAGRNLFLDALLDALCRLALSNTGVAARLNAGFQRRHQVDDIVLRRGGRNARERHLAPLHLLLNLGLDARLYLVPELTRIEGFHGLLVDYVEKKRSAVVIRGLRAISDFEYEFQMAMMNHRLKPQLETFFMMTGESEFYTSSRLVKEVVSLGGDVSGLVPDNVLKKLNQKFKR